MQKLRNRYEGVVTQKELGNSRYLLELGSQVKGKKKY
jgi:hypothetical protein